VALSFELVFDYWFSIYNLIREFVVNIK